MAITQQLVDLRTNVRRTCDIGGSSNLTRHPDASVNDAVNRGIAALYRMLTQLIPDQRYLGTSTITTTNGTSTYALDASCSSVLYVEMTANGERTWLDAYSPIEHAALTNPSSTYSGTPLYYRVIGSNIDLLPAPSGGYTVSYWFVPDSPQLTSDGQTIDTIARLDDYVIWYASREIATKDAKWELIAALESRMTRLEADIMTIARNRDLNAPPHVADERGYDRFGRRSRYVRRLR